MESQDLVNAIRRLKVETGSLACMGCGHKRNCGVSGCAIMREAADRIANQSTHIAALQQEIEKLRGQVPHWIPVEERLPENFQKVLCWGEYFRYGDFNAMFADYALGYQVNGNWGGEVTNGTKARALAWMPLPEPPEVENAETE